MARQRTPGRRRTAAAAAAVAALAAALALVTRGEPAPTGPAAAAPAPAASAPEPAPVAAAPAPPAAPAARPAPAPAPAAGSEEQLMESLRAEVDERPEVAVALAEQGEAEFPSGRHADERSYLHMRALVHLGDIGKARVAAERFFELHPDSPLGRSVFRLTGMRPRPPLGPPS